MLAAGNHDEAKEMFATSQAFAKQADLPVDTLMAEGWTHVCEMLSVGESRDRLQAAIDKLEESGDDGRFYAKQYDRAMRVFAKK